MTILEKELQIFKAPAKGGNAMPVSKAQQKAVNKYMKENYDRFLLTLRPKGRLDTIKAHATSCGESTSAFINRAISEAMERDGAAPVASEGEE